MLRRTGREQLTNFNPAPEARYLGQNFVNSTSVNAWRELPRDRWFAKAACPDLPPASHFLTNSLFPLGSTVAPRSGPSRSCTMRASNCSGVSSLSFVLFAPSLRKLAFEGVLEHGLAVDVEFRPHRLQPLDALVQFGKQFLDFGDDTLLLVLRSKRYLYAGKIPPEILFTC